MFYQTHHRPFFFSFNHFTPSIRSSTTTLSSPSHLLPSPPPPLTQAEKRMECLDGALKSSFRPEMVVNDSWTVNGQNGVAGDDFFVDDLLDFSKGDSEAGFFEAEEEREHGTEIKACSVSVSPKQETEKYKDSDPCGSSFSGVDHFGSIPADDLADLEWLSHFVEDSEYSLTYGIGKLPEKPPEHQPEPVEISVQPKSCFTTPVQTKARSKRGRNGGRVWSLGSPSLTESSSSSSSSSSSPSSSYVVLSQTAESLAGSQPPPEKKQRKKQEVSSGGSQQARRCSHCLVQKTPQWRAGPLGPKTLCNACGVRYKSGRLLPEYRPACSPTFSSEIHSNNHRKVLEMRRKKEIEAGLAPPVQSF